MTLVTHFDLELHQMDVKTAFLNGNIDEMIYMMQPENFVLNESKSMMDVKTAFLNGDIDETIYMMQPENFVSNESKSMILRYRSQGILRLSQETYINKVLERFDMKNSKPGDTLIAKTDKFSLKQCPNNDLERNEMQKISYASTVGSLMYAQVYIRPDIAFVVGVLGRRTKGHMLTYQKSEDLEIIGYSDSDFAGCQDSKCSTSGYIYMLTGGAISWKSVKQK
ncbi:hypothetical protein CR513_45662, partial [Mucuna pruriens]